MYSSSSYSSTSSSACSSPYSSLESLSCLADSECTATDDDSEPSSGLMSDSERSVPDLEVDSELNTGDRDLYTELLYEGASVTVIESVVKIWDFVLRFSLTTKATDDLLKLIKSLLPSSNRLLPSTYIFNKFLSKLFPHISIRRHKYCSLCQQLLEDNCNCSAQTAEFFTTDLQKLLQAKFADEDFWSAIKETKGHVPSVGIADVWDGKEYREMVTSGFLCPARSPANISLMLCTDGVSLFRSSQTGIWPVFLVINELPCAMRFSVKHVLLAGVWYSKDKPNMFVFLRPIIECIQQLYTEGIVVRTKDGLRQCRARLCVCTADLPAKALVCNMKAYNGEYACPTCLDKGDNTVGPSFLHRYWPFNPSMVLRTEEGVWEASSEATTTGSSVRGYNGTPILALHRPFQLVNGVVVDYLHCVLLGVTKMLMEFWFKKKCRSAYYIGNKVELCNQKLLALRVPKFVKRKPRSIEDMSHWKGSEFQGWLLWYSLPILQGILEEPYLSHYAMLVAGVGLLLKDSITDQDLKDANHYLSSFCQQVSSLYGPLADRINVHQLRHLTYHVLNWGPLWSFSCFQFESLNGELKRFYHGTRNMTERMLYSFQLSQALPHIREQLKISSLQKRRRVEFKYNDCLSRVGPFTSLGSSLDPTVDAWVGESEIVHIEKFARMRLNGKLIYSREYKRTSKMNNYTVAYKNPATTNSTSFAEVDYFLHLEYSDNREPDVVAVVTRFTTLPYTVGTVTVSHLLQSQSEARACISALWICNICVCITSYSGTFVALPYEFCTLSL